MVWEDDTLERLEAAKAAEARYHHERDFHADLAEQFDRRDWKVHREVWCDGGPGGVGRIDLLVVPPRKWLHAERIPAIGIEAKRNRDAGTHMTEFFEKLREKYVPATQWFSDRKRRWSVLPRPGVILYATPLSVALGRGVYAWNDEATRAWIRAAVAKLDAPGKDPAIEAAAELGMIAGIGFVFERILWKHGAAVLRGDGFLSNSKAIAPAQDGAARFYAFGDLVEAAA